MIADLFKNGSYWQSAAAVSPPPYFTEGDGYFYATDSLAAGPSHSVFIGDYTLLPGTYTTSVHVTDNPLGTVLYAIIQYSIGINGFTLPFSLGSTLGTTTFTFTLPAGVTLFSVHVYKQTGASYVAPAYMAATWQLIPAIQNQPVVINGGSSDYSRDLCYDSPVDYDTGVFDDPRFKTLAQLRLDLLRRLGYSAQAANPPPGMVDLLNSFLQDANEQLFERYQVLRLVRWWGWKTQVGQRYYDIPIDCTKYLDPRHIQWAGIQNGQQWYPLVAGINPLLYNQTYNAIPQYYAVTDKLELWPPPDQDTYVFWLKGERGPSDFSNDTDLSTVDARAVFLSALANAKAHYSQPDAARYDRQLEILLGNYTASTHTTKRYIPNSIPPVGMQRPIREV